MRARSLGLTSSCTRNRVPGNTHQAGARCCRAPGQRLRVGASFLHVHLSIHRSCCPRLASGEKTASRRASLVRSSTAGEPSFPHNTALYIASSRPSKLGAHSPSHRHVLALPRAIQARLVVPRRRNPAPRHMRTLPPRRRRAPAAQHAPRPCERRAAPTGRRDAAPSRATRSACEARRPHFRHGRFQQVRRAAPRRVSFFFYL